VWKIVNGFFRFDGPFFKYGTLLADLFILNLLWSLCSIPIITLGATTTAMYYVTTRQISQREGYISKDFFKSFKNNFIQATIITVLLIIISVILFLNIKFMAVMGNLKGIFLIINLVVAFELLITSIYIFPLLSRFNLRTIELFQKAFFIANRHILTTFTCLILLVAVIAFSIFVFAPAIVLIFSFYAYLTSLMFVKIFRKYIPEFDKDITEDGRNIIEN